MSSPGLQYFALYTVNAVLKAEAEVSDVVVNRIVVLKNNELWLATTNGPRRVEIADNGTLTAQPLLFDRNTFAICDDGSDRIFACDSGLLRQDRIGNIWYAYVGELEGELAPEWHRIEPTALPAAETLFLPTVADIVITPDKSLWLATAVGLARYYARERGMLYVAAANGWFRYDGRDLTQFDAGEQHYAAG